jgi:hypothetical protein
MIIRLEIDKVLAMKAGYDVFGSQDVDVSAKDLTEAERETLSHFATTSSSCDFDLRCFNYSKPRTGVVVADLAGVKTTLSIFAKLLEDENQKNDARKKQDAIDAQAKLEKEVAMKVEYDILLEKMKSALSQGTLLQEFPNGIPSHFPFDIRNEWANQKKKLDYEENERQVAPLKDWASQFGSELLIARISDGYSWLKLAHTEYANTIVKKTGFNEFESPLKYSHQATNLSTPSLVEISALRSIKDSIPNSTCTLQTQQFYEFQDDEDALIANFIKIEITCPDGVVVNRKLKIPSETSVSTAIA